MSFQRICPSGVSLAVGLTLSLMAAVPVHAQSVNIYGLIGTYVGSIKRSGDANAVTQVGSGGLTTSYLGFGGQESLAPGLKLSFALESFFRSDTGGMGRSSADPMWSRNAWVALEGDLGRLAVGRQTNPIYAQMGQLSPFGSSVVFSPLVLQSFIASYGSGGVAVVKGDTVWDNVIQWTKQFDNGLKLGGLVAPGEVSGRNGMGNGQLNLTYKSGPLYVAASVQSVRAYSTTVLTNGQQTALLGAHYDFAHFTLYGNVVRMSQDEVAHSSQWDAGVGVPVSAAGKLMLEASQRHYKADTDGAETVKRTTWSFGYDHRLSKRTDVYAIYGGDRLDGSAYASSAAVGIRHTF